MKRMLILSLSIMLLLPLVVHANQELLKLQNDDGQWVIQRKNYSATGYSRLTQITRKNVHKLKVAWSFSLATLQGQEGAPLVVGTTMYAHSSFPNHVYALDLSKEGAPLIWSYTPKQDKRAMAVACCDLVHRGLSYVAGKILMGTLDGHVIALNAKTGKEIWNVINARPSNGETMTGPNLIINNR